MRSATILVVTGEFQTMFRRVRPAGLNVFFKLRHIKCSNKIKTSDKFLRQFSNHQLNFNKKNILAHPVRTKTRKFGQVWITDAFSTGSSVGEFKNFSTQRNLEGSKSQVKF